MNAALLILDPQNDFFEADNPNIEEFERTVPVINSASALFREHDWPVIFIQHTSPRKRRGSHAWGIHRSFDSHHEDPRICKRHENAFWHTNLDLLLSAHNVGRVVLAGYVAEHCVLATYREALQRDYRAFVLADGVASLDNHHTGTVLRITSKVSLAELRLLAIQWREDDRQRSAVEANELGEPLEVGD